MPSHRGAALVVALMFLLLLTILGSALLTMSAIDVWISDNYAAAAQALYAAEAGIDEARELLRASEGTLSQLLAAAAGDDNRISGSKDLDGLLESDDQPLIPGRADLRFVGETLTDAVGRVAGTYHVWLRNDTADGWAFPVDSNRVVHLVSIARVGKASKTIEAAVSQVRFPGPPAALTLNGSIANSACSTAAQRDAGCFDAADSIDFRIDGSDEGPGTVYENAIGVSGAASIGPVLASIGSDDSRAGNYTGAGGSVPDVADVSAKADLRLQSVSGLESLVAAIARSADDTYSPAFGLVQTIGNHGAANSYRVAVVNGDCTFTGTGYGMFVVRGNLTFTGNFAWHGLILVIGQGTVHWNEGSNGVIHGGLFVSRTRAGDRGPANPLGTLLSERGPIIADFGTAGGGIRYNSASIAASNARLPFMPISYREH